MHKNTLNKYKRNIQICLDILTDQEKEKALNWYFEANSFAVSLSLKTGINLDTISQVIAVLSPGVSWDVNKKDAENLIIGFLNKIENQVVVSTYGNNKLKAIRILEGKETLIEKAIKTYNFYRNILDPEHNDFVTVDRHASKAMLGIYSSGNFPINKTLYNSLKEGYKELAKEFEITPSQLQAWIWVGYKKLVNR